jgi:hypothetical protein
MAFDLRSNENRIQEQLASKLQRYLKLENSLPSRQTLELTWSFPYRFAQYGTSEHPNPRILIKSVFYVVQDTEFSDTNCQVVLGRESFETDIRPNIIVESIDFDPDPRQSGPRIQRLVPRPRAAFIHSSQPCTCHKCIWQESTADDLFAEYPGPE